MTEDLAPRSSAQPSLLAPMALLERAADDLAVRYAGVFARETVERVVFESYTALKRTATVTTHLPTLAVRFAAERLTALAQAEGAVPKGVPEVLFLCTHNAGRSQMAAALMDHHAKGRVHVRTAGSTPADQIEPGVHDALAEIGLDSGLEFPKPLTDDVVRAADVVVTMGCGDACPVYPGKRYLDWDLRDPAGQPLDVVRQVRDDIDGRVRALLLDLAAAHHAAAEHAAHPAAPTPTQEGTTP